ncbi:hypothetical protein BN10_670019 [Phycicoccus elongatus Lp2]|uniref:Uncharacterized protein n=1 Tax=Phycicoccus elongatus Lp2 TaxID=1193181 RepID=N0E5Y0_9MICO|nr:hypothetical protein BN10_670019 [Phycicoccus elongatus Lp2]
MDRQRCAYWCWSGGNAQCAGRRRRQGCARYLGLTVWFSYPIQVQSAVKTRSGYYRLCKNGLNCKKSLISASGPANLCGARRTAQSGSSQSRV